MPKVEKTPGITPISSVAPIVREAARMVHSNRLNDGINKLEKRVLKLIDKSTFNAGHNILVIALVKFYDAYKVAPLSDDQARRVNLALILLKAQEVAKDIMRRGSAGLTPYERENLRPMNIEGFSKTVENLARAFDSSTIGDSVVPPICNQPINPESLKERFLRKLIEHTPSDANNYLKLGNLLALRKEHAQALAYLEKAQQAAPNDVSIMVSLAYVHSFMGDYPKALQFLKNALTRQKKNVKALRLLGFYYLRENKDPRKALVLLNYVQSKKSIDTRIAQALKKIYKVIGGVNTKDLPTLEQIVENFLSEAGSRGQKHDQP